MIGMVILGAVALVALFALYRGYRKLGELERQRDGWRKPERPDLELERPDAWTWDSTTAIGGYATIDTVRVYEYRNGRRRPYTVPSVPGPYDREANGDEL